MIAYQTIEGSKHKNQIVFLYKYSFLPDLNNLWVTAGKNTAHGDHESDDDISFLRLINLILKM